MPSSILRFRTRAHVRFLNRCFLLGIAAAGIAGLFPRAARAANNPVPFVDIVSPVSIHPGSTGVTLTLSGVGFVASSTVFWNGVALSTTFVNAERLTAAVPDGFVAAVGLGSVTVSSPGPGGGKSGVIYVPVASTAATVSFPSTPTSSVNVGTKPQGIVTADFNGDGNLDLAVANFTSGTVSILLGDGLGGFTTKSTPAAGAGANWLAVGDFNEDGIPDLAVANNSSTGVGGVSILLGNGDGTFTLKSSPATGSHPFGIVTGDFNGDGHLDLAVSNGSGNSVSILRGIGDGTFTAGATLVVGTLPQVIVAGDFNEDGKLDLIVANENSGTVSLLIGNGDDTFQSQAVTSTGGTHFPIGVIVADFNGDGPLDAAAVNASDVAILLGNGAGALTLTSNPTTGSSDLIAGVAGDYNGDGKLDLVVSDRGGGEAFLLPGIGDGTFGTKVTFTTAAGAFGVATADFNGDGALDLAFANGTANNVSIFLQLLPVTLNPTSLTFASQAVNTSSSSQPITLTNKSGGNLNFTSIGFTGANSGEFSQTNTCGASIINNATCTINVTFTPLGSGARVATLQIVDNASNSPQTLAVSGTGSASLAVSSATSTAFSIGSTGTFTVTTTGSPTPSLGETGALPSGLNFTDNGNGTATITGIPAGGSAGIYVLTITAHNGVATDVMQTFTLTVLGPPSIAKLFGVASTPVGATVSLSFTITNPNTGTALTGISFTDNLPAGLIVDSPNNLSTTCGGTATAVATSSTVSLSGGLLASSASCTISLNVLATTLGGKSNSVTVSDTSAGTGNTSVALLTVNKADTTTAVTSSANPSVFGQSVIFTATVSAVAPGTGTATGTVTFLDGGSPVGSGILSGGQATFTTSALIVGNHTITTSYGGDTNFNGSAGSLTGNPQVVNKTNTATAVTSSANPSVFGQSVIFTATVSPVGPGAGTASGTVTFLDGGSPVGSSILSSGQATFTTSALIVGNHTITTSYGGDTNFNGSAGSLTGNPQVVNKTNTNTAVTSSQNPPVFGQSVIFTATVAAMAPGVGTPSGTVTFLDGGSPVGSGILSSGQATFTTSALAVGNHTITTSYGGDAEFNGSAGSLTGNPQVVNKTSTTTAVNSSQNPTVFGQSVAFTATISPVAPGAGIPSGTVTFLDGGSSVGSAILSGGQATLTTTAFAPGNHTITTSYIGDASFNGSAGSLTGNPQVVDKANTATAVGSSANPSLFGQSVTLTATISAAAPGAGTPSGVVKFFDGGVLVASVPLTSGVGTFTSSTLGVGNHTFTTTYTGDGAFNVGNSSLSGNPQVVNKTDTTTAVTTSQNPSSSGQALTFTATLSPVAPGTGAPTGTVTFLDGGNSIGSGNLSGGVATFTISAMALGNHTITTTYAGSASFNASAGTLNGNPQVVNKIATTTALVSSQNSAALHQSVVFTATVAVVPPGSGTPTGTVTFLDGGSSIGSGTLSGGTATFTTTILAAGNHTITATYSGDSTSNTSNAALTGNPQIVVAPPVATKMFVPAIIALNGVSSLTITLTNPAANTVALTGVSLTDTFPANLVVATLPGLSNTCGGAATAAAGSGAASLNGASIPVNSSCTITLNVTSSASGAYANTTSAAGSANGGAGNTASATLTVADPPSITNSFGAASLGLGGSTTLSFVLTNSNSAIALTGVGFTDNLPSGLVVASPDGLAGACGSGVITAAPGSQIVTLAGGAIATSSSCTFSVNVTAAIAGNQVNTTGAVSAGNAGTGNTATASINVLAPDLILAKSHAGNFYQGQIGAAYNLTVSNTGPGPTLGTVTVTDALPTGLTATMMAGAGWNCTVGALSCARSDALAAAASYPAITVTVDVAANAAASVTNNAAVSGGGELNAANNTAADVTTVTLPPDFSLSVTLSSVTVRAGQPASYAFTVTPLNNLFTNPIALTVTGLPGKASVVFTPAAVTPGANAVPSMLVVTTTQGDPYVARNSGRGRAPLLTMLLPLAGLVLSGFGFRGRRRAGWLLACALLVFGALGVYGCAGVETNFQNLGTPAGSYTISVTGTSGNLQHSMPVTLVVQP